MHVSKFISQIVNFCEYDLRCDEKMRSDVQIDALMCKNMISRSRSSIVTISTRYLHVFEFQIMICGFDIDKIKNVVSPNRCLRKKIQVVDLQKIKTHRKIHDLFSDLKKELLINLRQITELNHRN